MTDAPKIVYDAFAQAQKPWTVGIARFLSRVERGFADAVEPLGLRADRRIGLKTGGLSFQPTIAIMPVEPADFGADYHADYVGAVFLQHETQGLSYAFARKSLTGSSCRFAALVVIGFLLTAQLLTTSASAQRVIIQPLDRFYTSQGASCAEDGAFYADARVAALKVGTGIRPDQEAAWSTFAMVIKDEALAMKPTRPFPGMGTLVEDANAEYQYLRQASLKADRFAAALKPLYVSLDTPQLNRFTRLLRTPSATTDERAYCPPVRNGTRGALPIPADRPDFSIRYLQPSFVRDIKGSCTTVSATSSIVDAVKNSVAIKDTQGAAWVTYAVALKTRLAQPRGIDQMPVEPAVRYDVEDDATERASSASRAAAESKAYMEALSGLEGILEPWQRTTLAGALVEAADLIQYLTKCGKTGAP